MKKHYIKDISYILIMCILAARMVTIHKFLPYQSYSRNQNQEQAVILSNPVQTPMPSSIKNKRGFFLSEYSIFVHSFFIPLVTVLKPEKLHVKANALITDFRRRIICLIPYYFNGSKYKDNPLFT